jgi:hypothetical protein
LPQPTDIDARGRLTTGVGHRAFDRQALPGFRDYGAGGRKVRKNEFRLNAQGKRTAIDQMAAGVKFDHCGHGAGIKRCDLEASHGLAALGDKRQRRDRHPTDALFRQDEP